MTPKTNRGWMLLLLFVSGCIGVAWAAQHHPIRTLAYQGADSEADDDVVVSVANPLPITGTISTTPGNPSTVINDTVTCATTAVQLPANTVEPGFKCCATMPDAPTEEVYIGDATVSATSFAAFLPVGAGNQFCLAIDDCSKMYCLTIANTQVLGVGGSGD